MGLKLLTTSKQISGIGAPLIVEAVFLGSDSLICKVLSKIP